MKELKNHQHLRYNYGSETLVEFFSKMVVSGRRQSQDKKMEETRQQSSKANKRTTRKESICTVWNLPSIREVILGNRWNGRNWTHLYGRNGLSDSWPCMYEELSVNLEICKMRHSCGVGKGRYVVSANRKVIGITDPLWLPVSWKESPVWWGLKISKVMCDIIRQILEDTLVCCSHMGKTGVFKAVPSSQR